MTSQAQAIESLETKEEFSSLQSIRYDNSIVVISPPLKFERNDILFVNDDCEIYGKYTVTDSFITDNQELEYVALKSEEDNAFIDSVDKVVCFAGSAVRITKNKELQDKDESKAPTVLLESEAEDESQAEGESEAEDESQAEGESEAEDESEVEDESEAEVKAKTKNTKETAAKSKNNKKQNKK